MRETFIPIVHHMNSSTIILVSIVIYTFVTEIRSHNCLQVLRRTVVYNDEFPVSIRLTENTSDSFVKKLRLVSWNGDGELRSLQQIK